jgi:glycosyltransferase involved in cell wall biosynthesis
MKVLFLFHKVGGGVDRASLLIYNSLCDFFENKKIHTKINVDAHYYYLIEDYKPDIIVTQDFFPFIIRSISLYKLKNNVRTMLYSLFLPDREIHPFNLSTFDFLFLPERTKYFGGYSKLSQESTDFFLPIEDSFKSITQWNKRKNFVYCGRINPYKFNVRLLKLLDKLRMSIDIYGEICDQNFFNVCRQHKSFNYIKKAEIFEMPSIYNNYKYHFLDSETDCFSISSLEAAACGAIPIILHKDLSRFKWCESYSIQLDNFDKLELLILSVLMGDFSEFSEFISREINKKYNREFFVEQFKASLDKPIKKIDFREILQKEINL